MNKIPCCFLIILLTLSLLGAGCTSPATPEKGLQTNTVTPVTITTPLVPQSSVRTGNNLTGNSDDTAMQSLLSRIGGRVNRSLETLDQNISGAAKTLGDTGISGSAADWILEDLAASPPVIDAVTVTNGGEIAAVMPARFKKIIGDPVANQSHIRKGFTEGVPVLSGEFATVEGFNAAAIVYPVRSANGTVIGLISVPFNPELLLSDAISPLIDERVYEVTVIQSDGRIIYATNSSQVGMMSLSDPVFISRSDLTRFINQVISTGSGSGTYVVQDTATKPNVTVENSWTTVSLHGTPWRIILDTLKE
ncbi:MAG: hypothetical protein NTV68_03050 [Methanomicrobiales archaeon]|nr:hypothetical protein [Methanomicrobiales archaeon]